MTKLDWEKRNRQELGRLRGSQDRDFRKVQRTPPKRQFPTYRAELPERCACGSFMGLDNRPAKRIGKHKSTAPDLTCVSCRTPVWTVPSTSSRSSPES